MRRPLLALSLATVLVVAGCAGPLGGSTATPTEPATPAATPTPTAEPTPTPTPTATPTPEPDVEVNYGETGVDETAVFERVEALTARDVERPTVYVGEVQSPSVNGTFDRIVGMDGQRFRADRSRGRTTSDGTVKFEPAGDDANVERTLAHEYAHVVQFETNMVPFQGTYVEEVTVDSGQAWKLVLEGGAVYVADAYVREHMPDARRQSTVFAEDYEDPVNPQSRLSLGYYTFGYEYVAARVDDPENLSAAYERMPTTTEQVLHHETRPREEPLDLPAESSTRGRWESSGSDRLGELYVRVLLGTQLDRERAVRAASGWGTDEFLSFTDGTDDDADPFPDDDGVVWLLRWDTVRDADEFESAARAFVDRRAPETDGRFRVTRPTDDTVAMVVGTGTFVENASVGVENGSVSVQIGTEASAGTARGDVATVPRSSADGPGAGADATRPAGGWVGAAPRAVAPAPGQGS